MAARPKPKKELRTSKAMLGPQTPRDKLFCERWLIHFDKDRAWREAGFAVTAASSHEALSKLKRFAHYLQPIKEAKAKIIAERLAVDSEKIVNGMAEKVFFDPTSFYERTTEPLTRQTKKKKADDPDVIEVVMWDGKPVYGERMKPYSDLTPEQRAVVEITNTGGDQISYRLPSIKEQHTYFRSLGIQIGMFAEKLIVQRHEHKHVHHTLKFENVPTAKLQSLTRQLLPMVELEFAQRLGFTAEDVQEAAEEGVLMPQKSPA